MLESELERPGIRSIAARAHLRAKSKERFTVLLRSGARLDQAAFLGQHHSLHSVPEFEVHKQVADVALHGCLAQV